MFNPVNHYYRLSCWATAIAWALFLLSVLSAPIAAQSNELKRVLILMQGDVSSPPFRLVDENAGATLRAGLPGGNLIFSGHLDRIHFRDPQFQAQPLAGIQRKYVNSKIDLVIGVGDVPTDLFPGIPMLYLRIDPAQKRNSVGWRHIFELEAHFTAKESSGSFLVGEKLE